jgi:HprK-related kinase B
LGNLRQLYEDIKGSHRARHSVALQVGEWSCRVDTNSPGLAEGLRAYFQPWTPDNISDKQNFTARVLAIQAVPPRFNVEFTDWPREPGKAGRKEEFADMEGGRIVRKVRTGMQFLIGPDIKMAVGPCEANDNQVINFVNSQLINWLLERDHVLCHAAAVVLNRQGVMIAGLSGGGKSTLALHLMSTGAKFTSNDRLLVTADGVRARMTGVPKLPRVNPGTVLNNPDLLEVIPVSRRIELATLSKDELWSLEEKYDADITSCFGPDRFAAEAGVHAVFVLNWDRNADTETKAVPADLSKRPDLLAAVMKAPGPFHETADGKHPERKPEVDAAQYLPHLSRLRAYEIRGKADFPRATQLIQSLLDNL